MGNTHRAGGRAARLQARLHDLVNPVRRKGNTRVHTIADPLGDATINIADFHDRHDKPLRCSYNALSAVTPSLLDLALALANRHQDDIRRRGGGRSLSRKVSPHAPPLRTRPHPTIIHHFPHFPRSRARPPPPLLPIPPSLPCASTPCSPPPCMRTRSTFLPPQVHPPPHSCFPRPGSRRRRLGLHAHAAIVLPDAQVEEAKNEEAAILPPTPAAV